MIVGSSLLTILAKKQVNDNDLFDIFILVMYEQKASHTQRHRTKKIRPGARKHINLSPFVRQQHSHTKHKKNLSKNTEKMNNETRHV